MSGKRSPLPFFIRFWKNLPKKREKNRTSFFINGFLRAMDFYEQLRKCIEESSGKVTMYDNEQYASLNHAIPTVDDLASYLFTFVALQPEQLTLAKSVSKRRNHDDVLNKLNELSTDSRLTYSQTLELVTIGFRALDPSIFDDINAYIPGPSERLADMVRDNKVDEVAILLSEDEVAISLHNENPFDTNLLNSLLFIAASNASDHGSVDAMVTMLLGEGADGNHQDDDEGSTPLIEASANGDKIVVKKLLDVDAIGEALIDVNLANYDGSTPLYEASSRGHVSVVELLLAVVGIDVNPTVTDGDQMYEHDGAMRREYTPLLAAIAAGHEKVVGMLLAHPNIKVNQADGAGRTPLFLASDLLLVIAKIDVNLRSDPLWKHIEREGIFKRLLAHPNIKVNEPSINGQTPLYLASLQGHENVVKMLLAVVGIDVNPTVTDSDQMAPAAGAMWREYTPLLVAIMNGHEKVVGMLLAHPNINVNQADKTGRTPLCLASELGQFNTVMRFDYHDRHLDVNQEDETGRTPLIVASRHGHEEVVDFLLKESKRRAFLFFNGQSYQLQWPFLININRADETGETPLIVASRHGHEKVVKLLLAHRTIVSGHKIDVNQPDMSGRTALYLAALKGNEKVVKLLLDAEGIDVNRSIYRVSISDAVYRTPLIAAIAGGHENVVKMLLTHPEININLVNYDGVTPLMGAKGLRGGDQIVEMLMAKAYKNTNQIKKLKICDYETTNESSRGFFPFGQHPSLGCEAWRTNC
jgi:ankyrin repeat protein